MTEQITDLDSWDAYPRIPGHEFGAMFPLAQLGPRLSEYVPGENIPAFFDSAQPFELLIVSGSIRVHGDQLAALTGGTRTLLVVDGDLHVDGVAAGIYYVSGDLHCHAIFLQELMSNAVGGRIVARDCAWATSDRASRRRLHHGEPAPALTLDTPLLLTVWVDIDRLVLVRPTLVLAQGRKEAHTMHVVASRFQTTMEPPSFDQQCCDAARVMAALGAGESIIRDGYDPAAELYIAQGHRHWNKQESRAAYLNFKKAATIAPGYYRAWQAMGDVLLHLGAYRQALPAFVTASRLFPQAQTAMVNDAADQGALCAIRCGEFATAIELATRSIEHNSRSRKARDCFTQAYLLRAEARLLDDGARNVAAAMDDLEQYLSLASYHRVAHWLKGLAYWHAGEPALAAVWHAQASHQDSRFARSYDKGDGTAFLQRRAQSVDWDTVCVDDHVLPEQDQAYWDDYMRTVAPDLKELGAVPARFRTGAMCEALLASCAHVDQLVKLVPPHAFTRKIAEKAVTCRMPVFRFIPPRLIDKSLCLMAIPANRRFPLDHVPAHVIDRELCEHALRCGASIRHIPAAYLDKEMYMLAVTSGACSVEALPLSLRGDDMIALEIAHRPPRRMQRHLPDYLTAPAYLTLAVERHKRALDAISGNLFGAAVYQRALRLYGGDADWPDIVARHDETFIARHPRACYEEVCWSVFWTEATMLRRIEDRSIGLCPCDIPAERFSMAVARACARTEPTYLRSIPARWIDASMCEGVSRTHPEQIAFMPLALRSASICARAMKADPSNFGLVPLARRGVQLCVAALRANPQRSEQVPARRRRQVFDTLIKKYAGEFDIDWLHRERTRVGADPDEAPDTDMLPASALLDAAQCLSAGGDNERALLRLRAAADMLTGAGCKRADLWARLLDLKRSALLELGRVEPSAQVCREIIERFGALTLFRDGAACNPVRAALRACYLQLATGPADDHATPGELEARLALLDEGLAVTPGPSEWNAAAPLETARVALLERLAATVPAWQDVYQAALRALQDD